MPTYRVTSPEGKTYDITAPDGASESDVMAYAQKNYSAPPKQPEMEGMDYATGAVNSLLQGATLSSADEIGSAIAAGGVKLGDFLTGNEGESWKDVYSSMMESEQAKRNQFAKENPKTALALEVAGGFTTGGLGGGKVLGSNAVRNLSKLKKTGVGVGVGATEGGVAGFNSGYGTEDRFNKAKMGATIGAAVPLAITGAGQVARKLSNKPDHIPDLDTPEGFMPLSLAAPETKRGSLVRYAGDAFGGGNVRKDSAKFLTKAADDVAEQAKMVDKSKNLGKNALKKSVTRIKDNVQKQTDEMETVFRTQALDASMPSSLDGASRDFLRTLNPQDASAQLGKHWVNLGFESAKKQTFDMDADEFRKGLKAVLRDDPALRDKAGNYTDEIMEDFDKVFSKDSGTIPGDELMELRNKYARAANDFDNDGLRRTASRKIASQIDDEITGRLKGADLDDYNADMSKWAAFSTYKPSAGKAGNKKQGLFNQDDWLSATKNRKLGQRKGSLQTEAQAVQVQKTALKKAMGEAIEARKGSIKTRTDKAKLGSRNKLNALKDEAQRVKGVIGKTPSLLSKTGNTAVLGSPMLGVGSIPMGVAVANTAGRQGVQKAMVGQTATQTQIRKLLEQYDAVGVNGLSIADILRQGAGSAVVAAQ